MNYAKALKNKVINKTSDVLADTVFGRKINESKSRGHEKVYKFAKGYNDRSRAGVQQSNKDRAIMQGLKDNNK